MRTGYIYMAVIMLQFFVFFNNVSLIFFKQPNNNIFFLSMCAYILSLIILVIGIVRGAKAGGGNCFMTLLFVVNMFFYVLYSFTSFLDGFINHATK